MAMQTAGPVNAHSPQTVGNAFVVEYYRFVHKNPEHAHKFYQESSMLSRPGDDGTMTSVTTTQGISDKIQSSALKDYQVEILTADSQYSCMDGVIVLVTGCLSGKDIIKRKFTQTFFLAPHDKGYYVLNDLFRFVDGDEPVGTACIAVSDAKENVPVASMTLDPEPAHAPDHSKQNHATTATEEISNNERKESALSDTKGSIPVIEKKDTAVEEVSVAEATVSLNKNDTHSVAESASNGMEGSPKSKMSYASIVAKESPVSSPVHAPIIVVGRDPPLTTVSKSPASAASESPLSTEPKSHNSVASTKTAPRSNSVSGSNNLRAEGRGIYVGNLPADVTVKTLVEAFTPFGTIVHDGIQIRRFQEDGFCYGFVEFESSNSALKAIEARRIKIGDKEAYIEEKKTVARGRGRVPSARGGFSNDEFRGRENYGGARGYGRHEYGNPGQDRGASGRNGEAYQRNFQNGGRAYGKYEHGNRGELAGQAGGATGRNGEGARRVFQNGGGRSDHQGGMN